MFPFAVYFAEAMGATIYALPDSQFVLHKTDYAQFSFVDLTGQYEDLGLRGQFTAQKLIRLALGERFPRLKQVGAKARELLSI